MKNSFKILFFLFLCAMIACSKDEISQELNSFVPHNKVIGPNKGEASDDEPIVEEPTDEPTDEPIDEPIDDPIEDDDPEGGVNYSIVRFPNPMYVEVDDIVGEYDAKISGPFIRPASTNYGGMLDDCEDVDVKVDLEKSPEDPNMLIITIKQVNPKTAKYRPNKLVSEYLFDKKVDLSFECPVKKFISTDNKNISLNIIQTNFEVNLKDVGIYKNNGYTVNTSISGAIYKDNFYINMFMPLIYKGGAIEYKGYVNMTLTSEYADKTANKQITYTEVKIDSDGNIITDGNDNVQVEEAFTLKDCAGRFFDPEMSGTAGKNQLTPTPTTVLASRIDSRTLKIELKNFSMEGVNVGDITAKCKAVLNEDGESYSLSGTTSVNFMGLVTLKPIVSGVVRKNQLQLNIHIDKVPAVSTVDVIYNGTRQE